jgi:hypothetical protein
MSTCRVPALLLAALLLLGANAVSAQPQPDFLTVLGGSGADRVFDVASDQAGNTYVVGETSSTDFPLVAASQATLRGSADAFVAKLAPNGSVLWATYFGGDGFDSGRGVAVDAGGRVWVTGYTDSSNLPLAGALDANRGGFSDAFILRLSGAGGEREFSTYFGGGDTDNGERIAVDDDGAIYVVGRTRGGLALLNPFQSVFGGGEDVFLAVLNPSATAYTMVSYFGGNFLDLPTSIGVVAPGRICIAGLSQSTVFPAVNPVQPGFGGGGDAFYALIDTDAPNVALASLVGGSNADIARGIACDGNRVAVVGETLSLDFPTGGSGTPVRLASAGARDGFTLVVTSATGAREAASYYGDFRDDRLVGVALAADGSFDAIGSSASSDTTTASAAPIAAATSGVHRSGDGGATWQQAGLAGIAVNSLRLAPTNTPILLAATDVGLYRSDDDGGNWNLSANAFVRRVVHDVSIDPQNPCTWIAGIESAAGDGATPVGAVRSTDCGGNWAPWSVPARRFRSLAFLADNTRVVAQMDRISTTEGGTLADTCLLDDRGVIRACLDQGASTNLVHVDTTAACRFLIGNESGSVTTLEGTTLGGCDHPLNVAFSSATPGSRVTALLALPSPNVGITRQIAGAADGRIVYRDGAAAWNTAATLLCAVSALAAGSNGVLAGGCPSVRAEGITELIGDTLQLTTITESTGAAAAGGLLRTNLSLFLNTNITSRVTVADSERLEALLFLDEPGTSNREVAAATLRLGNIRIVANVRGQNGYAADGARIRVLGSTAGINAAVFGKGPLPDGVLKDGFED